MSVSHRLGWPVYGLFMLAICLLVSALYSFVTAHRIGEAESVRLQAAQSQQLLAERALNLALEKNDGVELEQLMLSFERLQQVSKSDEVGEAWKEFSSQIPDASIGTGGTGGEKSADFSRLVELALQLTDRLRLQDAPINQVESAGHLHQLAQSVQSKLAAPAGGVGQPLRARGPWLVFEQILNRFEILLGSSMITDDAAAALVVETRSEFNQLDRLFRGTLADLNIKDGNLSRSALSESHTRLSTTLANFSTSQTLSLQKKNLWFRLGMLAALLSMLAYLLLALALWNHTRKHNHSDNVRMQREQASILRLLDEISALADGDLNTRATVSEDHTGAVADSINYAVGELRRLVGAITNSADRVTVAVEETGASATQLANASTVQAREIQRSATYLTVMSETMEHMTRRGGEATQIAAKTVESAVTGKQSIERVIQCMDQNSTQMQQTNMLLKRLVESSRQIGSALDIVNDVSGRTNLLALNTAIQAGTGSDQKRRFALISDEVQNLSNVLNESAREIEVLVRVIQEDARAAMLSVDHTGAGIVEAVRLSGDAQGSLKEIEAISRRLSVVVEHLGSRTSRQADVVKQLSANMDVINDVTRRSAHGMQLSSSALSDLKVMVSELRDGVADFVLPPVDERWSANNDIVGRPLLKKRESTPVNRVATGSGQVQQRSLTDSVTMDDGNG